MVEEGLKWKQKVERKASDDQWELFAAQLGGERERGREREEVVKQLNVNLHTATAENLHWATAEDCEDTRMPVESSLSNLEEGA